MKKLKLYDVVIVHSDTSRIVAVVGRDLKEEAAERRIEAAVSHTSIGEYFVKKVKPGAEKGDKV